MAPSDPSSAGYVLLLSRVKISAPVSWASGGGRRMVTQIAKRAVDERAGWVTIRGCRRAGAPLISSGEPPWPARPSTP